MTYGAWKITEREYQLAQSVANKGGQGASAAYQLVRYCRGQIFYRDDAEAGAKIVRAMLRQNVEDICESDAVDPNAEESLPEYGERAD